MSKILLYLSWFISVASAGQINIINRSLTDSSKNILYIGIDNQIEIVGIKNKPKNFLIIKNAGSTLAKINGMNYVVRVTSPGTSEVSLVVNGRKILTKLFITELINDKYSVMISGLRDTTITKAQIMMNPFLYVIIPGCYLRHNMHIISFSATFIRGNDSTRTLTIGNFLTREQLDLVKEVNIGDKIYFADIRATEPDGRIRKLVPFWVRIK